MLAGIGVALLSPEPGRHRDARLRLACFAAILLPLGLALQLPDHDVAVILQHYAAFFLLGAAILALAPAHLLRHDDVPPALLTSAAMTLCAVAFASWWRMQYQKGPVEMLLHLPWLMIRRKPATISPADAPEDRDNDEAEPGQNR